MTENQMKIRVNERSLEWDEDPAREPRACDGCGRPTAGRAHLQSPGRGFANAPFCLSCAVNEAFGRGKA